jgi:hypothetical protein
VLTLQASSGNLPLKRLSAKPKQPAPPQAPQFEPGRSPWIASSRVSVLTASDFEAIAKPAPNIKPNEPKIRTGIKISIVIKSPITNN